MVSNGYGIKLSITDNAEKYAITLRNLFYYIWL